MRKNVLLNLSDKLLTNKDVPGIIKALQSDPEINQLDLSNNLLGDQGITDLVNSTAINNVFYFTLYNNRIGDVGATAVVLSSRNNNIASLNLSKNRITVEGVRSLARHLPDSKIVNLDIIFNTGSEDPRGFKALLEATRKHRILQYLHVPSNYNRVVRPVLLENREYVSRTKERLASIVNELQDYSQFRYPMISLEPIILHKFQEFFYNQMLNSFFNEIKNSNTTCRKIQNYINDHFFKITGVVEHELKFEPSDSTSLANLPLEVLSRITRYCRIKDVKCNQNTTRILLIGNNLILFQ